MKSWILHPRDALTFRDGRQLWEGGSLIRSLELPWPSTLAGAVRHQVLRQSGSGYGAPTTAALQKLRQHVVHGPFLAKIDHSEDLRSLFAPAPADCLWVPGGRAGERTRIRLMPKKGLPRGVHLDSPRDLALVTSDAIPEGKTVAGPAFWSWSSMKDWLFPPVDGTEAAPFSGVHGLTHDVRVHTEISRESRTVVEGQLFRSDAVRFESEDGTGWFGLAFRSDAPSLIPTLLAFGADRGVVALRPTPGDWYEPPPELTALAGATRLRLVLLTPAIFDDGFAPNHPIAGAKVVAAAVGRAEIISGWDLESGAPKHTRRAAPAGSVYWVDLPAGANAEEWASRMWMMSVCEGSDGQNQRDGFGLVLVGAA